MDNSVPTSSELLHSFLDGELDLSMESSLFSSLHTSAELRAEMRDMIALQRAVRDDRAALVPPIASTAAVFGALGMSTSMLVSSGWMSALWTKIWMPVAAALVGSAVTWYAVAPITNATQAASDHSNGVNVAQNAQTQQPSDLGAAAVQTTTVHDTVVVTKIVPHYVSERRNDVASNRNETIVKTVYVPVVDEHFDLNTVPNMTTTQTGNGRGSSTDPSAQNSGSGVGSNTSSNTSSNTNSTSSARTIVDPSRPADIMLNDDAGRISLAPLLVRRANASRMMQNQLPDAVNISSVSAPRVIVPENFKRSFASTVRGLSGSSYVEGSIPTENGGGLNNIAIGGYYVFNEFFGLGLEFGRESFAMNFKGIVDGTLKRYEANPALTWGAVQAQVYPFPSFMESGWQPYVQANLGATNYGMLAKAIIGSFYSPTSHLRLMAGFEASNLFYSVQGTAYTTPKLGFTYGIGYQF